MAFPSLSRNPQYSLKEEREDSTIRSTMDSGLLISRQKFTRVRKKWSLSYIMLSETDVSTLRTFIDTTVHGGSDRFDWTNPVDGGTYSVRFDTSLPTFVVTMQKNGINYYSSEIALVEA